MEERNDSNGRITRNDLNHLEKRFNDYKEKTDRKIEKQDKEIEAACKEIVDLRVANAHLSERLTIYQLAQGTFATVASVIAAIVAIIIGKQ